MIYLEFDLPFYEGVYLGAGSKISASCIQHIHTAEDPDPTSSQFFSSLAKQIIGGTLVSFHITTWCCHSGTVLNSELHDFDVAVSISRAEEECKTDLMRTSVTFIDI